MVCSKELLRWLLHESMSSKYREWATLHFISTLGKGSLVVIYMLVSVPREACHISKHLYFQKLPSIHDIVSSKEQE